jgi:hypothetical protein
MWILAYVMVTASVSALAMLYSLAPEVDAEQVALQRGVARVSRREDDND